MSTPILQAPATGRELPNREKLLRPIPIPNMKSVLILALLAALLVWGMVSISLKLLVLTNEVA